jgi:hypothetical protein
MAQAFQVGAAIAAAVTDANPKDVVLKFEKVRKDWDASRVTPSLSCQLLLCLYFHQRARTH